MCLYYGQWYEDTDVPEEVDNILKSLKLLWQHMFDLTNEQLNIDDNERDSVLYLLNRFNESLQEFEFEFVCPQKQIQNDEADEGAIPPSAKKRRIE